MNVTESKDESIPQKCQSLIAMKVRPDCSDHKTEARTKSTSCVREGGRRRVCVWGVR